MKINTIPYIIIFLFVLANVSAQHRIKMNAILNEERKEIAIEQEILYTNTSPDTLSILFFTDWANSFKNKNTKLGKRFSEDFLKRFYYAKEYERGSTNITAIQNNQNQDLTWTRNKGVEDIIKLALNQPLLPGESRLLQLKYVVKLPSEKFTRYGYYKNGDFKLKYWYIVPAVYDTQWNLYSHKNLDDLYAPAIDFDIALTLPNTYTVTSELDKKEVLKNDTLKTKTIQLIGAKRNEVLLYLEKENSFYTFKLNGLSLISNIDDNELMPAMKNAAASKIIKFLENKLGPYPFDTILVSENDHKNNPVYGLNQLPDILRPFPDGFQYEIKQLKTITENYLEKTLLINPRYDSWIKDAIHIYLMMEYTEKYYPDMKIIGKLSNIIGIRWFYAADLDFNDQYFLGYKHMVRQYKEQPLTIPQDSLIKFNQTISNTYKAGLGFKYLEDYLDDDTIIGEAIQKFYQANALKITSSKKFEEILKQKSQKDIDWFFKEYLTTNDDIDFRISSIKKRKDSLEVTIKNKKDGAMPVSLTGLKDGKVISKTWVDNIADKKKVKIANNDLDKLVLDYDQNIPEINKGNNYRSLKSIFNKPIQFRFLQDIEDPSRTQIFYIPEFEFNNIYDGITIGSKFYNKTFIKRDFTYKITPSYGFLSQKLIGSASIRYRHRLADHGLYQINYSIGGSQFSYAPDLLFRRISPGVSFSWRPKDRRSNEGQSFLLRNVNIFRERNNIDTTTTTPNYSVFNARYRYSNVNLTNIKAVTIDYQLSKNFSKLSTTLNYRKIFTNNRQLNLRLFAGAFIFNNSQREGNFFSFALDRPTDYLFDYSYLGRSEDSGLTSQQIIIAEGGFKSELDTPFANTWITTLNANTTIWNWIYAYGDVGLVKNKGATPNFVFDAGIRLSLVADYFELFFPIVSNNGWETSQPNYDEKIRFIVTLSPQTLIRLFTREWY